MSPPRVFAAALALCAALFAFAFVAAPQACEWGLVAYSWAGIACLVVLFALPFVLRGGPTVASRLICGAGFAVAGAGVWAAGLFVANVRIICRLI